MPQKQHYNVWHHGRFISSFSFEWVVKEVAFVRRIMINIRWELPMGSCKVTNTQGSGWVHSAFFVAWSWSSSIRRLHICSQLPMGWGHWRGSAESSQWQNVTLLRTENCVQFIRISDIRAHCCSLPPSAGSHASFSAPPLMAFKCCAPKPRMVACALETYRLFLVNVPKRMRRSNYLHTIYI